MATRFSNGERVYLIPYWMDGEMQSGEWAEVLGYQGLDLYTVRVEEAYRDELDDGIREVLDDQIRSL